MVLSWSRDWNVTTCERAWFPFITWEVGGRVEMVGGTIGMGGSGGEKREGWVEGESGGEKSEG